MAVDVGCKLYSRTEFSHFCYSLLSSSPWLLTPVYYLHPHSPSARPSSPVAFIFSHILWHVRLKNDHTSGVMSVPLNRIASNFKRWYSNTRTNTQAAKKIQTRFVNLFTAWLLGSTLSFNAHFTTLLTLLRYYVKRTELKLCLSARSVLGTSHICWISARGESTALLSLEGGLETT